MLRRCIIGAWLFSFLTLAVTLTESVQGLKVKDQYRRYLPKLPKDYVDDEYHCDDKKDTKEQDDDTVACDPDTWEWDLDQLDPDQKPWRCEKWWEPDPEEDENYYEICLLWERLYGMYRPTGAPSKEVPPSPRPTPAAPTKEPTLPPTSAPPTMTTTPAPTPEPTQADEIAVPISGFRVRLVVSLMEQRRLKKNKEEEEDTSVTTVLDVNEWNEITQQHLVDQMALTYPSLEQLELVFVDQPVLSNVTTAAATQITQGMAATATFSSKQGLPTTRQLNAQVLASFEGTPKFAYLLLLEQADDPTLQQTRQVIVEAAPDVTEGDGNGGGPNGSQGGGGGGDDSKVGVAVGVTLGVVAVALVGGLFVYRRRRRQSKKAETVDVPELKENYSGDTDRDIFSHPDEERPSASSPPPPQEDAASVATSMYSYIEREDDTVLYPEDDSIMAERLPPSSYLPDDTSVSGQSEDFSRVWDKMDSMESSTGNNNKKSFAQDTTFWEKKYGIPSSED